MFTHKIIMRFTSERDRDCCSGTNNWLGTISFTQSVPCSLHGFLQEFRGIPVKIVLCYFLAHTFLWRQQLTIPVTSWLSWECGNSTTQRTRPRWNPSMVMLLRAIVTYIVCCFAILQRDQCRSSANEFSWVGFFKAHHYIDQTRSMVCIPSTLLKMPITYTYM